MSFLWSLKKLFSSKKNESRTESHPEKDLEEFRSVTNQTVQQIGDIKSTMAAMAAIDRGPLDHQQFHIKLHSFVKHLKQNDALREYVHCIYPENQQQRYYQIVEELSLTCDELSSTLKNMEFFNDRNARVAEMMIEVDQINSRHREKRTQVYTELETLLKQRLTHKWSKLKNSNNKQLLEQFLSEIQAQKDAMEFWQKEAGRIIRASTRNTFPTSDSTAKITYERLKKLTNNDGYDEVADDVRCTDELDDYLPLAKDSPSSVIIVSEWDSTEDEN